MISVRGEHSHEARVHRSEVLETMHKVRMDAAESDTKPAAIANHRARKRLHASLPSEDNMVRTIYKVRKLNLPAEPETANDITLEHNWTLAPSGEPWNMADIRRNGERALVFATEGNLQKLAEANVRLADGTFKSILKQFKQLYVIHG